MIAIRKSPGGWTVGDATLQVEGANLEAVISLTVAAVKARRHRFPNQQKGQNHAK